MTDIRDEIFKDKINSTIFAEIVAEESGILAGSAAARSEARDLGLTVLHWLEDGAPVAAGDRIARFTGSPKQIAMAEEVLMGHMAKPSGIATAAKQFVDKAGGRPKIVSGSWKKMPIHLKDIIRSAVSAGGASIRICDTPFLYLDKNYLRMLGGIRNTLAATSNLNGRKRVIQVHGHFSDIAIEACEAAENMADIIFIDTGNISDAEAVIRILAEKNLRQQVQIAFAGGIQLADIDHIKSLDIDILDVGRAIVDAPLLDMRLEVALDEFSSYIHSIKELNT